MRYLKVGTLVHVIPGKEKEQFSNVKPGIYRIRKNDKTDLPYNLSLERICHWVLACSIRIWTGKLPENIRKHRLKSEPEAACPLCVKDTIMQEQAKSLNKRHRHYCNFCPIMLSTGETCSRPYFNPNPHERAEQMLQILNKTQEYVNIHHDCEEI